MINPVQISWLLLALLASTSQAQTAQTCKTGYIAATAPSSRYQQKTDGSIVDTETGLMWRTCLEGVAGKACNKGEPLTMTWAGALAYVPVFNSQRGAGGHTDWRLPNIRELGSLVELQCADPAINLALFPNATSSGVWSSSPARFHTHYSWLVDFESGAFAYGERTKPQAIRLVRDARAPE